MPVWHNRCRQRIPSIPVNMPLILSLTLTAYLIVLPRTYLLRRLFNRWHRDGYQPRWHSMVETGVDLVVGYATRLLKA